MTLRRWGQQRLHTINRRALTTITMMMMIVLTREVCLTRSPKSTQIRTEARAWSRQVQRWWKWQTSSKYWEFLSSLELQTDQLAASGQLAGVTQVRWPSICTGLTRVNTSTWLSCQGRTKITVSLTDKLRLSKTLSNLSRKSCQIKKKDKATTMEIARQRSITTRMQSPHRRQWSTNWTSSKS